MEMVKEDLIEAVLKDDDMASVISTHLYVEAILVEFIEQNLPRPESFDVANLRWPQMVNLAVAFGLKEVYRSPLLTIGKIRNKFAHRLNYKISEDDANNLFSQLGSEDKKIVLTSMKKAGIGNAYEKDFKKCSPKERFSIIAVSLFTMLQAAIQESEII